MNNIPRDFRMRYRAVLWDYAEGSPGGGGYDSTLTYEQLPKSGWHDTEVAAREAGRELNECGDFFVRVEEEPWPVFGVRQVIQGPSGMGKSSLASLYRCAAWTPLRVRDPRTPAEASLCCSPSRRAELIAEQRRQFGRPLHAAPGLECYTDWSFFDVRAARQCLPHTTPIRSSHEPVRVEVFGPVLVRLLRLRDQLRAAFNLEPAHLFVLLLNPTAVSYRVMPSPTAELRAATRDAMSRRREIQGLAPDPLGDDRRVNDLDEELVAWRKLCSLCPNVVEVLNWTHFEYRHIQDGGERGAARESIRRAVQAQAQAFLPWFDAVTQA